MPHQNRTGGPGVTISFDGRPLKAVAGDTVAATLLAHGIMAQTRNLKSSTGAEQPRGLFCGMGVCHDCLVTVDGRNNVRSCMTKVEPGMMVQPQEPRPALGDGEADLAELPQGDLPVEAVEILVIGAGPGGLVAAAAARETGASVLVVDERPAPGGQFYKQAAHLGAHTMTGADAQMRSGAELIGKVQGAGIEIRSGVLIWGAFRDGDKLRLGYLRDGKAGYFTPGMMIIATGASEQPGVFPGWTLPGVMTTGAAQTLLRSYGVAAGQRVLVAGNGPLNLQVAFELARSGVRVVAVAEAAPAPWQRPAAAMAMAAAQPKLTLAGMRQLAALNRLDTPVYWETRIVRVDGNGRARVAVLEDKAGKQQRFDVDAVCVGEGFAPANELLRLLGAKHAAPANSFARLEAVRDDAGATSLADVFVVGEAGGFGGAHIAMAQGRLAGLEAARRMGRNVADDAVARRHLARHRKFQNALWQVFAADDPGLSRAEDNTIVCRCEAVELGEIKNAIMSRGAVDLASIKRLTRAGMGRCQGRYCGSRIATLIDRPRSEAQFNAPQIPLRPVPLAALAVEKPEWGGHRRAMLPPLDATERQDRLDRRQAQVVVIGAGIVGLSTAMFLARAGREVAVVDRGYPNARASGGNAGSLHAQLLSFDHGAKTGGSSLAAQTLPLQRDSIELWKAIQSETDLDLDIKITGGLMVAENERDLGFLAEKARVERSFGIDCDIIDAATLRSLEPALDELFIGAAFCPQEGKINPLVATQAVLDAALKLGVRVYSNAAVTGIDKAGVGFAVRTVRGTIQAGQVVNAAGAFAGEIGRIAGLQVPVFGAPLQMCVTEPVKPLISRLVAHADRHLTLKQTSNGSFLIGGGWTAGLDTIHKHPRPTRESIEGNLWVAQRVVPALRKLNVIRTWAAMNIDIDGAPILGEHPALPGFFNAVTSNGYTLAPLVGRITADLVTTGTTDRDVSPFAISRFPR
ncbi:FAD-dependent oxidoreductase [Devosia sp. 1566]|uniref:FAD-dependent oxidoreductase n=1 Tax=Devosia sp. 1566 TaxID=2499144 RepID=UPI0020BE854B|nr:FAD-dependent oxidoreductase [Devosia sp. 1566]